MNLFDLLKIQAGLLFLYESVLNVHAFEQEKWTVIDAMDDIYTEVSLLSYLPNVVCTECALKTLMADGASFSCHRVNRTCLIYNICHFRNPPLSKPIEDWRHFCSNINVTTKDGDAWLDLGTLVKRRSSLQFDVKSSQDAYIGLSSKNTSAGSGYWVILGGWRNVKSCVRDGFVYGSNCSITAYAGHLNPAQHVSFWITWFSGRVRVGFGKTPGQGTIMDYTFQNVYEINNLLLKNSYSVKAEWIIHL